MAVKAFTCNETKALIAQQSPASSLIHFNTRSLRKHHGDVLDFISVIEHNFSIICLSETWLSDSDGNLYGLSGYTTEYCNRDSQRGGGSAILAKSSLSYERRSDISFTNIQCESVWLEFDRNSIPLNNANTIVASIYRSPSSSYSEFCCQLEKILHALSSENKNIIICGDMNINIIDLNQQSCSEYVRCFLGFGLTSAINSPTRCDLAGSSTLIDHILTNITTYYTAGVIDYALTDHYPIFLLLGSQDLNRNLARTKSSFDASKFVEMIKAIDWTFVTEERCGEKAFNLFSNKIASCITQCTSVITVTQWYRSPRKPWISNALLRSITKKNNLMKKVRSQPWNNALKLRFRKYSNVLSSLLKRAKRLYYENEISKNGNDCRKNWQLIKQFLNSDDNQPSLKKITINGSTYTDASDIANAFSDHFGDPAHSQTDVPLRPVPRCDRSFYLFPTSADEVFQLVSSLKTTGPGLDSIHPSRIKLVSKELSPILAEIINKLFKEGTFPKSLKKGRITPVFKKGNRECIDNYRPICVLPFFSKIVEKLLYSRLMSYLTKFNLLTSRQFGFRPGYSTELALLYLTDQIKEAIDEGLFFGAVFIDLTKAFDTINHSILLHKLESFGISGPPLELIRCYLIDRCQMVQINGHLSSAKTVTRGVPQGSILGPLLFLLFINDLPSVLQSSKCLLYADDTTIFTASSNPIALQNALNTDLTSIHQWCVNNQLQMNATKTTFMAFHSPQKTVNLPLSVVINDHTIPASESTRFLGVILDKHLKFHAHAQSLLKKVSFGIHVILKARPYFPQHVILSLYYSYIHSHLSYCLSSWGNTYNTHLDNLQRLQNQAVRLMTFSPYLCRSIPLYVDLKILPLNELFTLKLAVIMFRLIHQDVHIESFTPERFTNNNRTRFSERENLLLPKARTNYGKMTAKFSGVSVWNSIPPEIKQSFTTGSFCRRTKKYLITELNRTC